MILIYFCLLLFSVTGFQLFLEKQKENHDGEVQEDQVQATMKLWKSLSPQEKKEWNDKAKGNNSDSPSATNNQQPLNNNKTVNKPQPQKQPNTSAKSKLSSFAFQKT